MYLNDNYTISFLIYMFTCPYSKVTVSKLYPPPTSPPPHSQVMTWKKQQPQELPYFPTPKSTSVLACDPTLPLSVDFLLCGCVSWSIPPSHLASCTSKIFNSLDSHFLACLHTQIIKKGLLALPPKYIPYLSSSLHVHSYHPSLKCLLLGLLK